MALTALRGGVGHPEQLRQQFGLADRVRGSCAGCHPVPPYAWCPLDTDVLPAAEGGYAFRPGQYERLRGVRTGLVFAVPGRLKCAGSSRGLVGVDGRVVQNA
ncbi:hypothetical protein GCM10010442_31800 [Kitasatospora kifunensis]